MNFGIAGSTLRHGAALGIVGVLACSAIAGCGNKAADNAPATGPKGNIVLKDENNYTAQSTLTIPKLQVMPQADLDICWSGLTQDLQCHPLSPTADIDNVSFLQVLNLSEADIATALGIGQSFTKSVKTYRDLHVNHTQASTCTKLSALSLGTTTVAPMTDFVEGADKTYMLLFSKGTTPGSGARTMVFIEPTAGSTVTSVTAPDGCGILDFKADLTTPQVVSAPVAGPYVADWSQITRDGLGQPVIFQNVDSLLVAFYQGKTVAQLQADFFNLETTATAMYQLAIPQGNRSADLTHATDTTGKAFSGFSMTDGVWAVGLRCSTCQVPAPVLLSILAPK